MSDKSLHETGFIERAFCGKEDHGILTVAIYVRFNGAGQGFGNLAFESQALADDFCADLCKTFGAKTLDGLVGQYCTALRCFPYGAIEALQAPSGDTFILTAWRRKHYPDALDPLAQRRKNLEDQIEGYRQSILRAEASLKTLEERYCPVRK